jgi:trehalose 6-phosphate phosphatase
MVRGVGMTHLLDGTASERLAEFAAANSVAVFDFDGTLAPIVPNRDQARMRRRTLALLTRLCSVYPCGVVSGRSLADTLKHLEGAPVAAVFGNHGLEPGTNLERFEEMMTQVRRDLAQRLDGHAGIEFEDKRYSIAVHYRKARNRLAAHQCIVDATHQVDAPIRLVEGICVVNLVPRDAPNKGDAVREIQRKFGAEQVLYVGDDITDEDVFRYTKKPSWLGVRVERPANSAADYFLCRQREIDTLLARLIRLRRPRRPHRRSHSPHRTGAGGQTVKAPEE